MVYDRPDNARMLAQRQSAQDRKCPRCHRLAAIQRTRARLTGHTINRCRWCGYIPANQPGATGEA